MSIATEITKLNTNLTASYTACQSKGATMPANQNFDNLATCINSIQTGSTPTLITKTITQNGTYNASSDNADGYSSVTVNVSGGGSFVGLNREVVNGKYSMPFASFTFSLPSNAIDIGQYVMYYAFQNCTGLTNADLSNLTTISGQSAMQYAFRYCTGLTSVDLSNLTTISGQSAMQYAFQGCTGLTSANFNSLTTLSGRSAMYYTFSGCTNLTSVSLNNLTTISGYQAMGYAFQNCKKLVALHFPSLTSTSFGSYTNQFNGMLSGVTGCTVHFPSNLRNKIGSWSSVTSGFGGTNTTVLFDLPATT